MGIFRMINSLSLVKSRTDTPVEVSVAKPAPDKRERYCVLISFSLFPKHRKNKLNGQTVYSYPSTISGNLAVDILIL